MFEGVKSRFRVLRELFVSQLFEYQIEEKYLAFRYENAWSVLRFAFYLGGAITIIMTISEIVSRGTLSAARLGYLLMWVYIILYRHKSYREVVNLYCAYFCVSIVFFTYQYYFILDRPLFVIGLINLISAAIIVSKVGPRQSVFIGLFIPLQALTMFVLGGELNPTTKQLVILLCLTTTMIVLSSFILERTARDRFQTMQDLETSRKKEASASAARMQFLAFMSHEIRTPLTAIIGYAQTIIEDQVDCEDQDKFVSRIKTNGDHLLRIVNDILDLSKIEQGKFLLYEEEVSLFELVLDTKFATENLAAKKNLDFTIDYAFPLPHRVKVDRGRLKQILINLIGNAVKFTEEGSIGLSVSADASYLYFSVTDTGIGISEDAADRLFQSFEQESAETTRKYGGSGLGLAISKRLANLMGGDLTFSSAQGQGASFTVTVALIEPDDGKKWVSRLEESTKAAAILHAVKDSYAGKVLVADDVKDNRTLLKLLLEKLGVQVDLAENGKQAIESALVTDYDLILMDIQMPVMDGVEAVCRLRDFGNDTAVIATTANVMDRDIQQYLSIGFDGHLGKPIDRGALGHILDKFLRKTDVVLDAAEESIESQIATLKQEYSANMQTNIPDIQRAKEDGNWAELKRICHALKGSASSFGFEKVATLASKIEAMALEGDEGAFALCDQLCERIEGESPEP